MKLKPVSGEKTEIDLQPPITITRGSDTVKIVGSVDYAYNTGTDAVQGGFCLPEELIPDLQRLMRKADSIIASLAGDLF